MDLLNGEYMKCNDCKYYKWYYSHCEEWKDKINPKEIYDFEQQTIPTNNVVINMEIPDSCLDCNYKEDRLTSLGIISDCKMGCGSVIGFGTGHYVNSKHPSCPIGDNKENI